MNSKERKEERLQMVQNPSACTIIDKIKRWLMKFGSGLWREDEEDWSLHQWENGGM